MQQRQKRALHWGFWGGMMLVVLMGVAGVGYMLRMGGDSLPVTGQAPEFTATNIDGKTVSLSSLNGKIRLLTWFYTHCPDECPLTAYRMAQIQDQLQQSHDFANKVVFISLTIDPKRDTLPVIRRWAAQYHADLSGWYFLRANPRQTAQILNAYGVGVKHAGDAEYIEHVVKTELIDQSGNVRVTYPLANLSVSTVVSNIRNLVSRESWL